MPPDAWRAARDPAPLMAALGPVAGSHQAALRRFQAACCRRIGSLLADPRSRAAVDAAERYADGLISVPELEQAADAALRAFEEGYPGHAAADARAFAASAAADAASVWPRTAGQVSNTISCAASAAACAAAEAVDDARHDEVYAQAHTAELAAQAELLRAILGDEPPADAPAP